MATQGDQIRQFFAYWEIVYFMQLFFLKITDDAHIYRVLFSAVKVTYESCPY
jgi:hypothetical protein